MLGDDELPREQAGLELLVERLVLEQRARRQEEEAAVGLVERAGDGEPGLGREVGVGGAWVRPKSALSVGYGTSTTGAPEPGLCSVRSVGMTTPRASVGDSSLGSSTARRSSRATTTSTSPRKAVMASRPS